MIVNGTEEKISGYRLLRTFLSEGLVYIPEDGFTYENGRHGIRDIAFSEELKYENGAAENLREITEGIVRLFYYVEADPYFHEDLENIGSLLRPVIRYEDLTGMTLLYLFTLPLVRLSKIRGSIVITADEMVLKNLPDAENRLKAMVKKCLAFTDDEVVRITVEKSDASLYTTIRIVPGMEATFSSEEPEEKEDRLTPRERNVRKNFALAMERVTDVIRSLEKEHPEAGALTGSPLAEAKEAETVKTVTPEKPVLSRLAEEGRREVRCRHIVLSLPKAFSEMPREEAGGQTGEAAGERVFTALSGNCHVRVLDFQPEETLPRRYLLSEETDPEDPGHILYDCFVQTGGGVQHLFFELKKAGQEEREDFRKIIEGVLRSIRWLQQ